MTTAAVEALSFASLTALLSNPPQYPRNPTHEVREPLVLYIVRVPGSKDVVLTPLKPPTKASISLDAIQSSLYYLHVESPEDEVVKQSMEAEQRVTDENKPPVTPIQRKPLPPTSFANYPPSQRPPTPPKSYPHYQPSGSNGETQHDRYVARGSHVRLSADSTGRPLGARPMPTQQTSFTNNPEPDTGLNPTTDGADPLKLEIPERPAMHPIQSYTVPSDQMMPTPMVGKNAAMSVTLIRRDPTSGAQWNVGTIRIGHRRHHLAPLEAVEVTLKAPGYSKFAGTPDSASPPGRLTDMGDTNHSPTDSRRFTRTLGFRILPDEQRTSLKDVRTKSNDFTPRPRGFSNPKKPRQVYSFSSPWQGMCIFSNGVDGKSLKVRHSLAAHRSTEAEQGNGVAELRLNLPWSVLKMKDANRQTEPEPDKLPISQLIGPTKKERFRRSMQTFRSESKELLRSLRDDKSPSEETPPLLPPRASTQEPIQDDYRLSLRLGREKAGGGFKGDSAKLGKLILEDEGLKMGDLVVACCMGVFWQHHEGS